MSRAMPPLEAGDERKVPLKVLIFSPEPSFGGGVAEFAEVAKRKFSPAIAADWFLTGRRPGPLGKAFRALVPINDAFRLAVRLMKQRHDVYHLNPSLAPRSVLRDGLFLIVLRLFRRREVLVFFRGWDVNYFQRIARSTARRFLFRWAYGQAARVLVLGSRFATDLKSLGFGADAVQTITTMFDGELLRDAVRTRVDNQVRILFLARFVAAKGIYELLEAFRRISLDDARTMLVMAGDGEEALRAREWCMRHGLENRVLFPGYVRSARKANLLLDSDIFVLPSHHQEGCPNALLEAMGAGLPTIVTPVGGILDIVRDGLNGLYVPPRNVDALERALRMLIQDPELRAAMAHRNREEAWQRYEAGVVTIRLEAHYQCLCRQDEMQVTNQG